MEHDQGRSLTCSLPMTKAMYGIDRNDGRSACDILRFKPTPVRACFLVFVATSMFSFFSCLHDFCRIATSCALRFCFLKQMVSIIAN